MSLSRIALSETRGARREPGVDDGALMVALSAGDLSALGTLYDRHAHAVRRFLIRATERADVADDLTQDAFLALCDAAPRYDPAYSVRSFAIGIAGKLVLRRRRTAAMSLRVLTELANWITRTDERTPEVAASLDEDVARYRAALAKLSEAKRVVVLMADVEGLTGPEIAGALSLPLGTVWTRLHHARTALRDAMSSTGATPTRGGSE